MASAKDGLILRSRTNSQTSNGSKHCHWGDDNAGRSLLFFGLELRVSVDDSDAQSFGTGNDFLALSDADVSADLGGVRAVVEQQNVEFLDIGHSEGTESVGEHVAGLFVVTVTNVHHLGGALETTADAAIDTARSAPGGLEERKKMAAQTTNMSTGGMNKNPKKSYSCNSTSGNTIGGLHPSV